MESDLLRFLKKYPYHKIGAASLKTLSKFISQIEALSIKEDIYARQIVSSLKDCPISQIPNRLTFLTNHLEEQNLLRKKEEEKKAKKKVHKSAKINQAPRITIYKSLNDI